MCVNRIGEGVKIVLLAILNIYSINRNLVPFINYFTMQLNTVI